MGSQHALQVVDVDGTEIKGTSRRSFMPRTEHMPQATSGTIHQTGHKVLGGAPKLMIPTTDLVSVWSLLSAGADIPYKEVGTALKWYYALADDTAGNVGYKAGATHTQRSCAKAGLVLSRLGYRRGSYVDMDLEAFIWDGAGNGNTQPWTDSSVALPTVPAWDNGYVLDTLTVGGQTVTDGLVSLELTIDHQVENNAVGCFYNGRPWPTRIRKPGSAGAIAMRMILILQDIDLAVASGDVVALFKDVAASGGLGSTGKQLSFNGIINPWREIEDASGDPSTMTYLCLGYYDGSNKPLTLSTP